MGGKLKNDYLELAKTFAAYQKKLSSAKPSVDNSKSLEAMTLAVTKMAEVLESSNSNPKASGLERLPVPSWDGSRRSYSTWKKEFRNWMTKYSQDEDEQLQCFRKAMPKDFWWTDLVKTCKSIDRAWSIKKQQEVLADRIVEDSAPEADEMLRSNSDVGGKLKNDYLELAKTFAAYQKKLSSAKPSVDNSKSLEAMTLAVTKMAEVLESSNSNPKASGLERLPVPSWDGSRRSYSTWKKEFRHWMTKYSQDEDEQLQCFRKAMPKDFWWTDLVKTCKSIDRAWSILDVEFADKRKLMDELLMGINNRKPVKRLEITFSICILDNWLCQ